MTPVLRAESIGKRFGQRLVLKAATLWAYPGRIIALVGGNGCGKSTLLEGIAGTLRFDYGAVHFHGRVYPRPRLHLLARQGMFFIPERGLLSPYLTLREHLALTRTRQATRLEAARALALDNLLDQAANQLSPGERRRADLALALLRTPSCLLADEPFQGIAPLDIERLASVLRLLRDQGNAIVISGHEISTIFDVADEVVWLTAGTTINLGSVLSARQHAQFSREYLGHEAGVVSDWSK